MGLAGYAALASPASSVGCALACGTWSGDKVGPVARARRCPKSAGNLNHRAAGAAADRPAFPAHRKNVAHFRKDFSDGRMRRRKRTI